MKLPFLAIAAALTLPTAALADPLRDTTPNIVVTGEASAELAPDMATIYFGVETERATATEAAAENARAAQAMIDDLKAKGVEPKDIMTRNVSLSPVTTEERDAKGAVKGRKTFFRARNELSARIVSLAKSGEISGALIEKGANLMQGVDYGVSDEDARRDALRAAAVKDAERRARAYVEAAGLHLGRVLDIRPEDGGAPAPMARMAAAPAPAAMAAVPLAPGVQKLSERVTITWALAR